MNNRPFIRVADLSCHFDLSPPLVDRLIRGKRRRQLKAVDGLSFQIDKGTTFSLVGESGCGKSTIARMLVGLLQPTYGCIEIDGVDLWAERSSGADRVLRRRLQIIFQDVTASLDPRWRVRSIVAEPMRALGLAARAGERDRRVADLLTAVGLDPNDGGRYPHEFSSGQRQRISIARALASNPEFLVCDEPTSALDVSVQAQILNLLKDLQQRLRLTLLFISHNLAVVAFIADVIGVVYLGRFCEVARTRDLLRTPRHPYTRLLLESIPDVGGIGMSRTPIAGEVPSPIDPPAGCTFHPRCPIANDRCRRERPELLSDGPTLVACHAVEERRYTQDATRLPVPPQAARTSQSSYLKDAQ